MRCGDALKFLYKIQCSRSDPPVWHAPCMVISARKLRSVRAGEGKDMKLIIAVIKPFKLEEVREALTGIGVQGLMVSEVKGYGRQSGHTEIYRGAEYVVNFVPKIKLEIAAPTEQVEKIVETIATTARTGKIGDGKVFVLNLEQAVRVRTDERGEDAL